MSSFNCARMHVSAAGRVHGDCSSRWHRHARAADAEHRHLSCMSDSDVDPACPNPEPCSHSHSSPAAGLRTITILPPDKSKGPRCTAVGTADGASLLLDPILVLSGPPVAWLAPIEAATKLAVKISIQQAMSDAKRAKKDAWVRNAFLQAAIVSSRIMFTVRPALCETGACLRALTEGMADVDVSANVLGVL